MQKITKGNISYYTYSHFNPNVIRFTTTRYGGVSKNNYQTLNMGLHTGEFDRRCTHKQKLTM